MFSNKAKSLRIVKLTMQETGTYNPQYARPYTTHFDGAILNAVTERIIDNGQGRIDNSILAGIAGNFITPSPTPEAAISMVNGWGERRVRFLMEVECSYQVGGSSTTYVQGYTSFPGVSVNQAIAPDMVFYVNSLISTKKTHTMTPFGMQVIESVTDNSHLLCSNNWNSMTQPGQQMMMRPQDVFAHMSNSHIPGMFDNDFSTVYDGRTTLRSEATKSNRRNGLAGGYASRIIDGYVVSNAMANFGQSESTILSRSRQEVSEEQAAIDPFLAAIASITSMGITNNFKYSDLVKLDPNVDANTNYTVAGSMQRMTTHQAGQTSVWHGQDRLTLGATILSQAVPSIMMDLMLNRLVFKSSNHDFTGAMVTTLIDGGSFSNMMDLTQHYDLFKRRLEREVLQDLTFNNQVPYSIEMRIDMLSETWISISMDGQPSVDFVTPSFCDNLFVPVVTANQATVQGLTSDFESLVLNVKEAIGSSRDTVKIATTV